MSKEKNHKRKVEGMENEGHRRRKGADEERGGVLPSENKDVE